MKKYSKFLIQIALVLLFVVPLTLHNVNGTWTYYEGKISSVTAIIKNITLGKFDYEPKPPRDDGYINDFPDPDPEGNKDLSQDAFDKIMGEEKDDYTNTDVGLNNINSKMNKILDKLKNGQMITSIDLFTYDDNLNKVSDRQGGHKNSSLYGVGSDVHFAIVKNSGDKSEKFVTVYTTNTQLYTKNNDYEPSDSYLMDFDGGFVNEVYRAQLRCYTAQDNDVKYGYEIQDSKRGYCRTAILGSNNSEKEFFDPDSWQYGESTGMVVKLMSKDVTYDFGTNFDVAAYNYGSQSPIPNNQVKWTVSNSKYARVSNGHVEIVKYKENKAVADGEFAINNDDIINYGYQTINVTAEAKGKKAVFSFKINKYPLEDGRGMGIDKDTFLLTGGIPIDAASFPSGILYTNGNITQGIKIHSMGYTDRPIVFTLESIDEKMTFDFFCEDTRFSDGVHLGKAYMLDLIVMDVPGNPHKKNYQCDTHYIYEGDPNKQDQIFEYYLTVTSRTPVRYEVIQN